MALSLFLSLPLSLSLLSLSLSSLSLSLSLSLSSLSLSLSLSQAPRTMPCEGRGPLAVRTLIWQGPSTDLFRGLRPQQERPCSRLMKKDSLALSALSCSWLRRAKNTTAQLRKRWPTEAARCQSSPARTGGTHPTSLCQVPRYPCRLLRPPFPGASHSDT